MTDDDCGLYIDGKRMPLVWPDMLDAHLDEERVAMFDILGDGSV